MVRDMERLTVCMYPDDFHRFDQTAKTLNRKKSELARWVLKNWLDDFETRQAMIDAALIREDNPAVRRFIKKYNCLPEEVE